MMFTQVSHTQQFASIYDASPGCRVQDVEQQLHLWSTGFPLLILKGLKQNTLAMLVFLSRQGEEGFQKAACVSWLGASREGIHNPNSWVAQSCREKLHQMGIHWTSDR